MLDRPGTALVTRSEWVRVPPLALSDSGVAQWESTSLKPRGPLVRPQPPELTSGSGPLAGHGFREPGEAGSIPASLTAGECPRDCPAARRWCGRLLTGRVQVRVLPGQLGTEGRADWRRHPVGSRARRKPLQVQLLSLPLADRVRGRAAEAPPRQGGRGGCDSRRTLLRPVTQRVWRLVCPTGEAGSSPAQGAEVRAVAERRGTTLIRWARQVRLLPTRLTVPWGSGVPAALTPRRPLVRVQPGRLTTLPWSERLQAPRS